MGKWCVRIVIVKIKTEYLISAVDFKNNGVSSNYATHYETDIGDKDIKIYLRDLYIKALSVLDKKETITSSYYSEMHNTFKFALSHGQILQCFIEQEDDD